MIKTWELFKYISSAQGKNRKHFLFEATELNTNTNHTIYVDDLTGELKYRNNSAKNINLRQFLDLEWEEIAIPVSFDEVVKSGEWFRASHEYLTNEFGVMSDEYDLESFMALLGTRFTNTEIADILINGEFVLIG